MWRALSRRRRRTPSRDAARAPEQRWVRVAVASHQPEAEMLAGLLSQLDIPVLVRRYVMDVPDMMAGGPRELLVPAGRALEAWALLGGRDEGGEDDER